MGPSIQPPDALAASQPPASLTTPAENRNLFVLALHSIVFRIGWTFKQESVIMSVLLDAIAGPAWIRGLLPTLSRLGQTIPPLWWAGPLREMPSKKWSLAAFSVLGGAPYLALAALWWSTGGERRSWMPWAFLGLHLTFFLVYGLQQISLGTVQGKLVPATRRGFLLWTSQLAGVVPVVLLMRWLMPSWLGSPSTGFVAIFFFAGVSFVVAGTVTAALREPTAVAPSGTDRSRGLTACIAETGRVLAADRNFRWVLAVAALFSTAAFLAPHYQAYARTRFGLSKQELAHLATLWVIVQTISVSGFSLALGPLADWRGNRVTLRTLIVAAAAAPLTALAMGALPDDLGRRFYWVVFIPQGLTPLLIPLLINYVLEISAPADHPRYLSTLTIGLAVPYFFSPLLGSLISLTSFETIFWCVAATVLFSGGLTCRLAEPRRRGVPSDAAWAEMNGKT